MCEHLTARNANLAPVKSENRLAIKVILEIFERSC